MLHVDFMSAVPSMEARNRFARRVRHNLEGARREVDTVDHRVRRFTIEKPLIASFTALAVGFVVGRWVSRR